MAFKPEQSCEISFELDSYELPVLCPLLPPSVAINEMQVGVMVRTDLKNYSCNWQIIFLESVHVVSRSDSGQPNQ